MDWLKLQNGSDIRGVALRGIPGEEVNLSPQVAGSLGRSFAEWLKSKGNANRRVAVGMDSRITGPSLKKAVTGGLTDRGMQVFDCGMTSTPAMFMTTVMEEPDADAAVMLTASHLPFNRNGMKFFTRRGGVDKKDITEILEMASGDSFTPSPVKGRITQIDFTSGYAGFLADVIRKGTGSRGEKTAPLQGLKIIVDAGNGAGGFFAGKVLLPLGADITGSQYLEPDGRFPNHSPNPEDPEAMACLCEAVRREKADLGIIFDTDVDRAAVVDRNGNPVNRNELIALISVIVLEEHPGTTIVTDSITSDGLTRFIEDGLGGIHHRFRRGYRNVINEAERLNREGKQSWLAIETSGHAALRENHFLDDGAYLVARLLVKMAELGERKEELTGLIKNLERPVESGEFRFSIKGGDFTGYAGHVMNRLAGMIPGRPGWKTVEPNYEGIRVRCAAPGEKGWFLIRMSLHDPVMPLNIESDVRGGVSAIASKIHDMLSGFDRLDISSLKS